MLGTGDTSAGGSPATDYRCGALEALPIPVSNRDPEIVAASLELCRLAMVPVAQKETSYCFRALSGAPLGALLEGMRRHSWTEKLQTQRRSYELQRTLEDAATQHLGFGDATELIDEAIGHHPLAYGSQLSENDRIRICELAREPEAKLVMEATARQGPRRQLTKKSYLVDRRIELIAHIVERSALSIIDAIEGAGQSGSSDRESFAQALSQLLVGIVFGRFRPGHLWGGEPIESKAVFAEPQPPRVHLSPRTLDLAVGDLGHDQDLARQLERVAESLWGQPSAGSILDECGQALGGESLRNGISNGFFAYHIGQYTASRRKAPIYWQISTPSASYSVWLYYHRLTHDTLYRVLNDYVSPKLQHEERKLAGLLDEAGRNASAGQRKEIDTQQRLVAELRVFRGEVARVAPLWKPHLDDGVIINFAPLWRLVPQNRSWQKECKRIWNKLVGGEYDWAHLAMHLWPERVVPRCSEDLSLAIAHGIEEVLMSETASGSEGRCPRMWSVVS